jgi:hypothetical protein
MRTCCVLGRNEAALTQLPSGCGGVAGRQGNSGHRPCHMGPFLTKGIDALKRLRRNQAVGSRDKHRSCPGGSHLSSLRSASSNQHPHFHLAEGFSPSLLPQAGHCMKMARKICNLMSCRPRSPDCVSDLQGSGVGKVYSKEGRAQKFRVMCTHVHGPRPTNREVCFDICSVKNTNCSPTQCFLGVRPITGSVLTKAILEFNVILGWRAGNLTLRSEPGPEASSPSPCCSRLTNRLELGGQAKEE